MKKVAQETSENHLKVLRSEKLSTDLLKWYGSEEEAKLEELENWAWVHLKLYEERQGEGEAIYREIYDTVKDWKKLPEEMPEKKDAHLKLPGKTTLTLVKLNKNSRRLK